MNEIENLLENALNEGTSATKTLGFIAQNQENIIPDFDYIGKQILESNPQVDVIQYLEEGEIVAVYPLAGNEVVLGYNLLEDPVLDKEVKEAIRRKNIYFSGPLKLMQGGIGIVGRYPVFQNGNLKGIAASIIRFERLLQHDSFSTGKIRNFAVQLSKINPNTGVRENFDLIASTEELTGHKASTFMPIGNWTISVQLIESTAIKDIFWMVVFGFSSSALLGLVAWNFARQPFLLRKKVAEQSRELVLANERFELASKATSDVIWDWDLETNEKYRSSQFSSNFGYSEEEVANNKQFRLDLIHPEDKELVKSKLRETLAGDGLFWEIEFRARKADQTYAYVAEKGYIIRNPEGKAIRMIGATQNITKQKMDEQNLIQANERFELASRATSDVIWDWDLITDTVYRTKLFFEMFGYQNSELTSKSNFWESLIHPDDLVQVQARLAEILLGSDLYWQQEFRVRKADNSYAFIIDKGYIIRDADGKPTRMIGAIQDISRRKAVELMLLDANQKLSNANEELNVFASLASHDMREPLRMISSFMSLLDKKYSNLLDEKGKQYIYFAKDGASRLTVLINDLLEYSKVGFDQQLIEEINTGELLDEVLKLKETLIRENDAILKIGELPDIRGIRIPLKMVFQNLIGNALKYKNLDSQPIITISGKALKDFWEFSVEDNGIGIEAEYLESIFTILKRLNPKDKYPGTGMGLATCRKIVNQHGGKIWAESTPGVGSKFLFLIKKHEH